jgi:U3 small nucleolar RNA-associated protein 3
MAKKRKASRNAQPSGPKELDPADARLGPVSTYEDVANSEDEYFIKRDELMLNDEPGSKRRRTEDDDIEFSDEEILGYEDTDEDEAAAKPPAKSKKAAKKSKLGDSDDEAEDVDEEGDEGWWGASKKEYYDADNIETEGDALEEEAEAKRLQQKKLSKMTDEDFIFDGDEWLAAEPEEGEDEERVTEVLKDMEITDDMGPEERYRMLKSRYPEFEYLVGELQEKKPILEDLRAQAKSKGGKSLEAVKYWVLGCYVAALASYFAILTSPARDVSKAAKPLDPSDLRDHEIMETLVTTREAWRRMEDLKPVQSSGDAMDVIEVPMEVEVPQDRAEKKKLKKKLAKEEKVAAEKRAKKLAKAKEVEETVADLYDLPLTGRTAKKQSKEPTFWDDSDSDFGEETALDARTAADKAARKKSLKFYTSQIAQKANRRAGAGRDAGGDMDIPYRERLKDRQARLLREAERRGQKDSKRGADLGDNSDDDDASAANAIRNDEDEYYDMVAHKAQQKKEDKAGRYAAYAAASKADRVVENEEVGEDGKRRITYAIEKNKGLTPRRKKDVRNPRVKKRKQYDAKKKKLASMKPIWKGGEPKGGYRGETSGINTAVIKSVKL